MMTVPPQLTSSLPSFSYPASFRHPPPASSIHTYICMHIIIHINLYISIYRHLDMFSFIYKYIIYICIIYIYIHMYIHYGLHKLLKNPPAPRVFFWGAASLSQLPGEDVDEGPQNAIRGAVAADGCLPEPSTGRAMPSTEAWLGWVWGIRKKKKKTYLVSGSITCYNSCGKDNAIIKPSPNWHFVMIIVKW